MRALSDVLSNFHWIVAGKAARSSQGLGLFLGGVLKRHGIRSLVNLRGAHRQERWWQKEERLCARLSVRHFDAMLDSRRLPTQALFVQLVDAFDAAPEPLLIKCAGGQDRAALASAIYLLNALGWEAMDAAMAQLARLPFLHFPKKEQRWLAAFPLYAKEQTSGTPIGRWIRESYDPESFAAWLRAHDMGESFAGILRWKPKESLGGP